MTNMHEKMDYLSSVLSLRYISDQGWALLHTKHLVYNGSTNHSLLSTYQMREMKLLVDDVAKRHVCDQDGNYGTQSIQFPNGHILPLSVFSALMTCHAVKPTMEDYTDGNLHVYDIVYENWTPSIHYDEPTLNTTPGHDNGCEDISPDHREISPNHKEISPRHDEISHDKLAANGGPHTSSCMFFSTFN